MDRLRSLGRGAVRSVMYSSMRPRIDAVVSRVHNHLYNVSTDASSNGEGWLISRFPADGVFLDVGYNEGSWSRRVLAEGQRRTVHAFDPSRSVIRREAEMPPTGDFHFHPIALASSEGRRTFYEYGELNGSSSLADRRAELGVGDTYEVEASTVDSWASRCGVDRITVLKVDAEGFDLDIMEGARGMLTDGAVDLVVFEYASGWVSSGRTLMQASEFVSSVGYDLYRLFPSFIAPFRYRVQHEGAAMTGYFVALNPRTALGRTIPIRNITL